MITGSGFWVAVVQRSRLECVPRIKRSNKGYCRFHSVNTFEEDDNVLKVNL